MHAKSATPGVVLSALLLTAWGAGCGGATDSKALMGPAQNEPPADAGADSAQETDARSGSVFSGSCARDEDCDDGVACTLDGCVAGSCAHEWGLLSATGCASDEYCDHVLGCKKVVACASDDQCFAQLGGDACKANVRCVPETATCYFDVLDGDLDLQPPIVCGGADCNDASRVSFSGAPELCDGLDNDCDGIFDEEANCPGDQFCDSGQCRCPAGRTLCNDSCTDLMNDPAHCGTCSNACPNGAQCVSGNCCLLCDGVCVDFLNDVQHCGSCTNVCPSRFGCTNGSCVNPCNVLFCPSSFGAPCCTSYGNCGYDFGLGMGCVQPCNTSVPCPTPPTGTACCTTNAVCGADSGMGCVAIN